MSNVATRHRALLLLGPTGSGKTPLGDLIEERGLWEFRWAHFDFGAHLRSIADEGFPAGRFSPEDVETAKRALEAGVLLENDQWPLAERIFRGFLAERAPDVQTCIVLNGLPRHADQARAIDPLVDVGTVLSLRCTSETVLQRIRSNVGGDRAGRTDDDPEMVRTRVALFNERTEALVEYYREADIRIRRIVVTAAMTADDIWRILQGRGC
jgi:adenylate kinase family enzyme